MKHKKLKYSRPMTKRERAAQCLRLEEQEAGTLCMEEAKAAFASFSLLRGGFFWGGEAAVGEFVEE